MRLSHRFGLKRVAKLLMLRDERHRSFFLFLAVLRAVVQGYVKNKLKRHIVAKIAVCYRVIMTQSSQHNFCHVASQNLMTVVASYWDAMLTTQFSSYCKREVKINMQSLRSMNATPPTGVEPATTWLTVRCSSNWAMADQWWPNEKRIGLLLKITITR